MTRGSEPVNGYTPEYFNNPLREYDGEGRIVIRSEDERFKNEFYTVIRTLQRLVVDTGKSEQFILDDKLDR